MNLRYHKGKNVGDAINAIIFPYFLGDILDNSQEVQLLGIGSLLGLIKPDEHCEKFLVFSTGFAAGDEATYGGIPVLNDKYEIICLRGPKTAKALGLSVDLSISDGALLLPLAMDLQPVSKKYSFSYMPHVGSLDMFPSWNSILKDLDIHFIDPRANEFQVIQEMRESEVLITEAMHGAILADALRIPWIPVKAYKTVNEFKWKDYLASVELDYNPTVLPALYSVEFAKEILKGKFRKTGLTFLHVLAIPIFKFKQKRNLRFALEKFENLKQSETYLCKEDVLKDRQDRLLEKMNELKTRYAKPE